MNNELENKLQGHNMQDIDSVVKVDIEGNRVKATLEDFISNPAIQAQLDNHDEDSYLPEGYIMIPMSAWEEQMEVELERDNLKETNYELQYQNDLFCKEIGKLEQRLQHYQNAVNRIDDMFEYGKHTNVMSQRVYSVLDELTNKLILDTLPSKKDLDSEEVDIPDDIKTFKDFNNWMAKEGK